MSAYHDCETFLAAKQLGAIGRRISCPNLSTCDGISCFLLNLTQPETPASSEDIAQQVALDQLATSATIAVIRMT